MPSSSSAIRQGRRLRGRVSPCTILQTAEVGWFGWITGALLPPDAGIVQGWPVVAAAWPIPTKLRTQPLNGLAVGKPAHRYQHSLAATGPPHCSHHCARHPCRIWQKTGPKHRGPRCAGRSDPSSAASSTQFPERCCPPRDTCTASPKADPGDPGRCAWRDIPQSAFVKTGRGQWRIRSLRPPSCASMSIHYTVLLLLNATHGCLAEIELAQPEALANGARHWIWMEGNTVTTLQLVGGAQSSKRVFDHAVLTFDGVRGQLDWPIGRCDLLSVDTTGTLRPEFQRLLHQHLN